jgi:hypothetical protein
MNNTIPVYGRPQDPGCWIDGRWGQYAPDRLVEICREFGMQVSDANDPKVHRAKAERREQMGKKVLACASWEQFHWATEVLERRLNAATKGGRWQWEDGELFLRPVDGDGWELCQGCGKINDEGYPDERGVCEC